MTEYSTYINDVKTKCTEDWLTPSQRSALEGVLIRLETNRIVNVYGKEGTGKTFLGWILEKKGFGKYSTDWDALRKSISKSGGGGSANVIVDNFPSSRELHRQFRSEMGDLGMSKAVLISEFPIPDEIPKMELEFNDMDRKHFKHTCYDRMRLEIADKQEQGSMHDLIRESVWS